MGKGIELILDERQRQIKEKGYTLEHDKDWVDEELAIAAACYAVAGTDVKVLDINGRDAYPFGGQYDKRDEHGRIRCLTIAGALIAAEIDRLASKK